MKTRQSKIMVGLIAAAATLTQGATTWGSGCMWYDRYEFGIGVGRTSVAGVFACYQIIPGSNTCVFTSADGVARFQSEQTIASHQLPPQGQRLTVDVTSRTAMHWQDCDGSDPTPPFVANGIHDSFTYQGQMYGRFRGLAAR